MINQEKNFVKLSNYTAFNFEKEMHDIIVLEIRRISTMVKQKDLNRYSIRYCRKNYRSLDND